MNSPPQHFHETSFGSIALSPQDSLSSPRESVTFKSRSSQDHHEEKVRRIVTPLSARDSKFARIQSPPKASFSESSSHSLEGVTEVANPLYHNHPHRDSRTEGIGRRDSIGNDSPREVINPIFHLHLKVEDKSISPKENTSVSVRSRKETKKSRSKSSKSRDTKEVVNPLFLLHSKEVSPISSEIQKLKDSHASSSGSINLKKDTISPKGQGVTDNSNTFFESDAIGSPRSKNSFEMLGEQSRRDSNPPNHKNTLSPLTGAKSLRESGWNPLLLLHSSSSPSDSKEVINPLYNSTSSRRRSVTHPDVIILPDEAKIAKSSVPTEGVTSSSSPPVSDRITAISPPPSDRIVVSPPPKRSFHLEIPSNIRGLPSKIGSPRDEKGKEKEGGKSDAASKMSVSLKLSTEEMVRHGASYSFRFTDGQMSYLCDYFLGVTQNPSQEQVDELYKEACQITFSFLSLLILRKSEFF